MINETLILKSLPFNHFKSIKFSITYPEKLIGHLIYLREHYEGYKVVKGDNIDKAILGFAQQIADKASYSYIVTLLTNEQLEQAKMITRGLARTSIFHFQPDIADKILSGKFKKLKIKNYPLIFDFTFWSEDEILIDKVLLPEYLIEVPEKEFVKLKTIKRIPSH